jgi:5-(carboxyamino)imidazole ribonucleotide synthase
VTNQRNTPLPPGATIGILGGGQLGRMAALSAARLGYRCHIFSPDADAPAKEVSAAQTTAPYEDKHAARAFARAVDVVTFEFENVPDETLAAIGEIVDVRPGVEALHVSQDRAIEKTFLANHGIGTAPWAPMTSADELAAAKATGFPAILKTARFGYDGKGQVRVETGDGLEAAWAKIDNAPAVLEGFVDFEREISVIVARGVDGNTRSYTPVDNVHRDHILYTTTAPSTIDTALAGTAREISERIATALGLVGLLAVEMFVTQGGEILVNEIAPRPHNSGHWTMDACAVSQFEQFIRAVAGLPLGDTERHSDAVMINLIADEADRWLEISEETGACLHLYGKAESRPGRKMGHVNRLSPRVPPGRPPAP